MSKQHNRQPRQIASREFIIDQESPERGNPNDPCLTENLVSITGKKLGSLPQLQNPYFEATHRSQKRYDRLEIAKAEPVKLPPITGNLIRNEAPIQSPSHYASFDQ